MDAFVDAVAWHDCAFLRSRGGEFWRVWYDGWGLQIERLIGEPEWTEPLNELKRRQKVYEEPSEVTVRRTRDEWPR